MELVATPREMFKLNIINEIKLLGFSLKFMKYAFCLVKGYGIQQKPNQLAINYKRNNYTLIFQDPCKIKSSKPQL